MDKFDRIYKLHGELRDRRTPISRAALAAYTASNRTCAGSIPTLILPPGTNSTLPP